MITFDPHLRVEKVVIVGMGGTGSQVARSVARMLYDARRNHIKIPPLWLIDPDIVEEKNVGRQLFTAADIGQPKAHVLMRRFNLALGLDCVGIHAPVDAKTHLKNALIIGCVDNHLARRELAKADREVWIDSGNHKEGGQVIIGNVGDAKQVSFKDNATTIQHLPNAGLLFPQLLEPEIEAPIDESCADLLARQAQALLVNDWMAVVTAQYVYKLFYRQPITSFMTYVDTVGMSVKPIEISRATIDGYHALPHAS